MATTPNSSIWSPLRHGVAEIRLLVIEPSQIPQDAISCLMENFPLSATPAYQALSYAWGDPKITETMHLNGHPFEVTTNLHAALKRLRSRKDVSEKDHQIPLMRRIFSEATRVIIWLGEEENDTPLAFEYIKRCAKAVETLVQSRSDAGRFMVPSLWDVSMQVRQKYFSDLKTLFSNLWDASAMCPMMALTLRGYWKRIWIVQEIVLGRSPILLCGGDEVEYTIFSGVLNIWARYLRSLHLYELDPTFDLDETITYYVHQHDRFVYPIGHLVEERKRAIMRSQAYRPDLLELISTFKTSLSTDPRDRIYGLLGLLSPDDVPIRVDYNLSFDEVYMTIMIDHIEKSKREDVVRDFLRASIGWCQPDVSKPRHIPSWVSNEHLAPDYYHAEISTWFRRSKIRHSQETKQWQVLSPKLLKMTGILCDDVLKVSSLPILVSEGGIDQRHLRIWECLELTKTCPRNEFVGAMGWRRIFLHTITGFTDAKDSIYHGPTASHMPIDGKTSAINRTEANFERLFALLMEGLAKEKMEEILGRTVAKVFLLGRDDLTAGIPESHVTSRCSNPHDVAVAREAAFWLTSSYGINGLDEASDSHVGSVKDQNKMPPEVRKFVVNVSYFASGRSFFVTRSGYMGLGPRYMEPGDQVCMFSEFSIPTIVRKAQPNYVLVGDAFVPGMMKGEMMDQVERGERHVEDMILQ